ncbi:MAG TPA: hypothetical protein VGH19_06590 [Verrucomicrobiae bacterium]
MTPEKFAEANLTLKTVEHGGLEVQVPAHTNRFVCTVVYRLNEAELSRLVRSGRLAISLHTGTSFPLHEVQVLDKDSSPQLEGMKACELNEPVPFTPTAYKNLTVDSSRPLCRLCDRPYGLHSQITHQCPKVRPVEHDETGLILLTGFLAAVYEPKV